MMMNNLLAAVLAALLLPGGAACAASATATVLADSEDGLSFGVDGRFSPTDNWSVGAGVAQSQMDLGGADFSGTAMRLSSNVTMGAFMAGASVRRWKDTSQVSSTALLGELGFMWDSGLSVTALLEDRDLRVTYEATILGEIRSAHVDFEGTGVGADVSWFGADWNLGVRYLDYDYGRSVARVRAAMEASTTDRFPRVETLLDSIVTRAMGAPDRQFMATIGRRFARSSIQADWAMQRDALTQEEVKSLSLTYGRSVGNALGLDVSVGYSDGTDSASMAFGVLALTWQSQHAAE
jgi:hypothetical protein